MKGFSLIELMIALAIIGVISSIAYPSYQGYIQDTYYAQARADVKVCVQALELFNSNGFTYVGGGAQCTLWSHAIGPGGARQYTFAVPVAQATTFTVLATPVRGTGSGRSD